ncbi:site-specific DNA-methyltransferase, partial [Patescibacteria group bacterium]|nr:site-specific DNA-methyltransferase [Patescibacteria group bacterium]
MENLLHNLKTLLQKDERLVSEGELLKNKIIELALKLDKELIKLLLSDKKMKEVFFVDVDGTLIFDKDKFVRFVSNKQFLPDSYTSFKNKIGLTVDDEFLSEKKEVVISWPYKDCVLEGGMTKEDQKRDEIFWNEILAPDEISRLFDPKVFTNAKRIDKNGEHKLDKFRTDGNGDIKDNLIIKGNNLLALHSLKKRFAGRVKLIYIDPPYNQEGSTFYNDSFKHSSWLTFMKNRLEVAWQLLKQDGVIFIQMGEEELAHLKVLTDELFTRDNFISIITRVAKTASNKGTYFAPSTDFLLCYARDINSLPPFFDKVDESLYKKVEKEGQRKGERYRDNVALYQSALDPLRGCNNQRYFIRCPDGSLVIPPGNIFPKDKEDAAKIEPETKEDKVWRWTMNTYLKNKHLLIFKKTKTSPLLDQIRKQAIWNIYTKSYLSDRKKVGTKPRNFLAQFINRKGADYIKKLGIEFNYPKPVELIQYLIEIVGTDKDDIIMDFFAGSATTAEAVLRVNKQDDGIRQFILCEQMDYVDTVTKERVKKVIEINDTGGFVYLELMKWNENFVEKIQKAKTKEELKKLWETMKKKAFLSYKAELKVINEHAKDFEDLSIENQKRFLLECLDKNHLYVNYSEIDDKEYGVSEENKK